MRSRLSKAIAYLRPPATSRFDSERRRLGRPAQHTYQTRRIPAASSLGLHLRVKLVDQGGHRQRCTARPSLGKTERQVFAHPVYGEAEVELVREHRLAAIVHLPRLRGTFADHFERAQDIEPGLFRERDPFCQRLDQTCDADLVKHLRELTA